MQDQEKQTNQETEEKSAVQQPLLPPPVKSRSQRVLETADRMRQEKQAAEEKAKAEAAAELAEQKKSPPTPDPEPKQPPAGMAEKPPVHFYSVGKELSILCETMEDGEVLTRTDTPEDVTCPECRLIIGLTNETKAAGLTEAEQPTEPEPDALEELIEMRQKQMELIEKGLNQAALIVQKLSHLISVQASTNNFLAAISSGIVVCRAALVEINQKTPVGSA